MHTEARSFTTFFALVRWLSAHGAHTKMATFTKLPSGSWRVQIRRKGRYVSETFLRRDDARIWAVDAERQIDRGEAPTESRIARLKTFGELIDLHIEDMCAVGKAPLRSKAATLDMLKKQLGKCNTASLDRERLIRFGRDRAAQGAGPVRLALTEEERQVGISKQGDGYIRRLLVVGATAVLRFARQDNASRNWATKLLERKPGQAGRRRLGQQDGAHRLGGVDARGELRGAGDVTARRLSPRGAAIRFRGCLGLKDPVKPAPSGHRLRRLWA